MLVYNGEFDLLSRRLAVIACPKFFSFFFFSPTKRQPCAVTWKDFTFYNLNHKLET